MKSFAYLVKEPGNGAMSDIENLSKRGEVTVIATLPGYIDFFRKKGYNTMSFDKWDNCSMDFTATIGNPPYTDPSTILGPSSGGGSKDLDCIFYAKAMERSSYVSMIIRSKFFAKKGSAFRKKLFGGSEGGLISLQALPESTFPTISLTETCIPTWKRGYRGPTKITFMDGTVKEMYLNEETCIKLTNPDYVVEVSNNMAYRHQTGDVFLHELKPGNCPMVQTMGGFRGNGPIITMVDESQHFSCVNQHGVIMNSKYGGTEKSFGAIYVKQYEHSISSSAVCLKTNSLEESERLRDYLLSEEVKNLVRMNKISNVNSKELFKTIPDMPNE
jgi:hypothetical protein